MSPTFSFKPVLCLVAPRSCRNFTHAYQHSCLSVERRLHLRPSVQHQHELTASQRPNDALEPPHSPPYRRTKGALGNDGASAEVLFCAIITCAVSCVVNYGAFNCDLRRGVNTVLNPLYCGESSVYRYFSMMLLLCSPSEQAGPLPTEPRP